MNNRERIFIAITSKNRYFVRTHSYVSIQSPRSQLHQTGKVMQTSMFRTNKKALIFMRFEQNEFKQFFVIF